MKVMYLIRGLPGSGKSTLAKALGFPVCEADNFFIDEEGKYNFDPSKLPQAHLSCQQHALSLLQQSQSFIVSNTFSQGWELKPYLEMASQFNDFKVTVIDLFDNGCSDDVLASRNTHEVPLHVISMMRQRWEHDWNKVLNS